MRRNGNSKTFWSVMKVTLFFFFFTDVNGLNARQVAMKKLMQGLGHPEHKVFHETNYDASEIPGS